MNQPSNPADAVREALDRYSFGPQYAELSGAFLGNGMDKDADGSWVLHADHARVIAALTARVEDQQKMLRGCAVMLDRLRADRDKQYLFALSRDGSLIEVSRTIAEIDAMQEPQP